MEKNKEKQGEELNFMYNKNETNVAKLCILDIYWN